VLESEFDQMVEVQGEQIEAFAPFGSADRSLDCACRGQQVDANAVDHGLVGQGKDSSVSSSLTQTDFWRMNLDI
jgi:hypothetical protein